MQSPSTRKPLILPTLIRGWWDRIRGRLEPSPCPISLAPTVLAPAWEMLSIFAADADGAPGSTPCDSIQPAGEKRVELRRVGRTPTRPAALQRCEGRILGGASV